MESTFIPDLSVSAAHVPERVRLLLTKFLAKGLSEGGVTVCLSADDLAGMGVTEAELADAQSLRIARLTDGRNELPVPSHDTSFSAI